MRRTYLSRHDRCFSGPRYGGDQQLSELTKLKTISMQISALKKKAFLVLLSFTLAAGYSHAQTKPNDAQILNKILDSANGALRINAVASGGAGGPSTTFLTSSQIYNLVYDSANNALKVNIIAGGGGGGGGGITSLNALSAATQTFVAASLGCVDFTISSAGSTHTFCIPTANLTARGLLSSSDWSTFNAKENALTFNAPLIRSTNTISIPAASGTQAGYLSSADWNTFNSKQNALTFPLGLAQGGTNQTAWTANRCVRVNSAGNALEPAGADCGSSSGGITNLNGLTVSSQSFLIGTAGVSPNWVSATSTHTLNIPLASASGVTAGLIAKADYDAFNAKENSLTFTSPLSRATNTISCPTCELMGNKGTANGYAPLNASSQIPAANLPALSGTGTCTNQFVRGLNDKAAPACSYVTASDVNTTIEITANKNQANGYAGLDASFRIAKAQAPATTAYTDASNTFSAGTQDFSGAAATRPFRLLAFASFPATCAAGRDMVARTDPASAGQVIYICNATGNGWVLVGDGGGSGAVSSVFGRTGAVSAQAGDYTAAQVTNAVSAAPTADQTIQGSADVSFIVKQPNVTNTKNTFEVQLKTGTKSFYIDPNGDVHYAGALIGDGSGVTVSTFTEGAAPSVPTAGKCVEYVDSATHTWKFMNSSGTSCLDIPAHAHSSATTGGQLADTAIAAANKQGSGTKFAMASGSFTSGNYVKTDANGNLVDGGSGTGGGYNIVQNQGTPLTQRATLNLTGAGVTCADNAGSSRTDCTIAGGGGGTNINLFQRSNNYDTASQEAMSTAGTTWGSGFWLPESGAFGHVRIYVSTVDNSANNYRFGIYNSSGSLVTNCDTGNIAGSTWGASTGFKVMAFAGTCTLAAGKYYFSTSAVNSNTAKLGGVGFSAGAVNITFFGNGQVAASVFPASFTPPSNTYAVVDNSTAFAYWFSLEP